jgi:hypothetical protein
MSISRQGSDIFRQNLTPEEGKFAVKQKRFNVELIVAALKQAEAEVLLAELIRAFRWSSR